MDWDLEELSEARDRRAAERKAAIEVARRREWLADMLLGRAIARARDREIPQKAIAAKLGLSREQVRRLELAWRESAARGEITDTDLDAL
jgi:hypothetical protein